MTVTLRDIAVESETDPEFPDHDLNELEKKITATRWVVPVLPEQELEKLLIVSIKLARRGKLTLEFSKTTK